MGSHLILQSIFLTQGWTWVSCTAGRFFTIWATREAPLVYILQIKKCFKDTVTDLYVKLRKHQFPISADIIITGWIVRKATHTPAQLRNSCVMAALKMKHTVKTYVKPIWWKNAELIISMSLLQNYVTYKTIFSSSLMIALVSSMYSQWGGKTASREQNLASRGQRKITLFMHKANIHTVHKQNLGIKVSRRDQLQKNM